MNKKYESVTDFMSTNLDISDWSEIDNDLAKEGNQYKVDEINFEEKASYDFDVGDSKGRDKFDNYELENLDMYQSVKKDELASFIWFAVLETYTMKNLFNRLKLPLTRKRYLCQLVPLKSKDNKTISYSILIFHKNYNKSDHYTVDITPVLKKRILHNLYSGKETRNTNLFRISDPSLEYRNQYLFNEKGKLIFSFLNIDRFEKILKNVNFQILILPYPEFESISYHPDKNSFNVANGLQSTYTSSGGIITKNQKGDLGCTICYHDFISDPNFGIGSKVMINNHQATIKTIHKLSDSCFAVFDNQNININYIKNNGPLINITPQQGPNFDFVGLGTGGKGQVIVTGWNPSIPFVRPNINIINQQMVYTTPNVRPGDSGCALIDNNNYVIGFAGYRTGIGAPVPFSAWIWAEEVYYHHKLTY